MIQTIYGVKINLDGKEFNISVSDPNSVQKELLETKKKENGEILKEIEVARLEYERKIREAKFLEDKIALKMKILDELDFESKVTAIEEISKMKNELLEVSRISPPDIEKVKATLESLLKYKSELLISGDDKDALLSEIENKGVSHERLWAEISVAVNEAAKKNESDSAK